MYKYILKRLLMMIPVLLGVTFIVFFILNLSPGDPAAMILGDQASEEALEMKREELGLNDPLLVRYGRYVVNMVQGDLGTSYKNDLSVWDQVMERFPNTAVLAVAGILVALIIGIPTGIISAKKQYSAVDNVSMVLSLIGVSMPNFWFALMLSTLFLPQVVLNVPQFLLFTKWGWVDSYLPLVVPSFFACDTYFVFMLVQFMRGISRELEEAAEIDGCNSFKRFIYVVLPMVQPSLVSCALFQFMWSSNDFMGPLIYLNSTKKFTASLGLRMIMDTESGFDWNKTLALSVITLIPSLIIFFLAQDQFVEGIAAGGVKG